MEDAGMPVPALETKPDIEHLQWLWEAFVDLDTCRAIGFDAGPIPWLAIQRYAETYGMDAEEQFMLHGCIRHMDGVLTAHRRSQAKKA